MSTIFIAGIGGHAWIHVGERSCLVTIARENGGLVDRRRTKTEKRAREKAAELLGFWGFVTGESPTTTPSERQE